jgi:hypothetical protein
MSNRPASANSVVQHDDGQWRYASEPVTNWRALASWVTIIAGFSAVILLLLL